MMRLSPDRQALHDGATNLPVEFEQYVDEVVIRRKIEFAQYHDTNEIKAIRYAIGKEIGALFMAVKAVDQTGGQSE